MATAGESLPREWPERRGFIAAGGRVAFLLGVSANLGSRVIGTNDEARFPMLARDILQEGHWLLPRLDGMSRT